VELWDARRAAVGHRSVNRALPRRERRTVGAWCFADHFGPAERVDRDTALAIGPHPHIGLHTVTWLYAGEVLHTDSLGNEQPIRAGQLNLMTAGHGIAHAEMTTDLGLRQRSHGVQLWVAQPEATRHGPPAFEHHAALPRVGLGEGAHGTVLVGELLGAHSPTRADTPLLGVDLVLNSTGAIPLDPTHEHCVVVLTGGVRVDGVEVEPNQTAYLGTGRDELVLRSLGFGTRALLLGGAPFGERVLMWWNFVARTRDEIDRARAEWNGASDRFGPAVASGLERISAPMPPWR